MARTYVGTTTRKKPKTKVSEKEFIAECKRTTHRDGRVAPRRPFTITVMAADGFTVLYETTPVAIARDLNEVEEDLHVYDENLGDMKQLATAISTNSDCYFELSKETETGSVTLTYIAPSFTVDRRSKIHMLRGQLSNIHKVRDET